MKKLLCIIVFLLIIPIVMSNSVCDSLDSNNFLNENVEGSTSCDRGGQACGINCLTKTLEPNPPETLFSYTQYKLKYPYDIKRVWVGIQSGTNIILYPQNQLVDGQPLTWYYAGWLQNLDLNNPRFPLSPSDYDGDGIPNGDDPDVNSSATPSIARIIDGKMFHSYGNDPVLTKFFVNCDECIRGSCYSDCYHECDTSTCISDCNGDSDCINSCVSISDCKLQCKEQCPGQCNLTEVSCDYDADEIHNINDMDADGDGILNGDDFDINNDSIQDQFNSYSSSIDLDNDKIINMDDPDIDGDGILNGNDILSQTKVLNLNGGYLSYTGTNNLPSFNNGFTISAWIKVTGSNYYMGIVDKSNWDRYDSFSLYVYNNKVYFSIYRNQDVINHTVSPDIIQNQWYHITATYNGTYMGLYVGDNLVSTALASGFQDVNGVLKIGAFSYTNNNQNLFKGQIDDVKLFSRGLTGHEVSLLSTDFSPSFILNTPGCSDSDGASGAVSSWYPGKRGTRVYNSVTDVDHCEDAQIVHEYWCDTLGSPNDGSVNCGSTSVCSDGQCSVPNQPIPFSSWSFENNYNDDIGGSSGGRHLTSSGVGVSLVDKIGIQNEDMDSDCILNKDDINPFDVDPKGCGNSILPIKEYSAFSENILNAKHSIYVLLNNREDINSIRFEGLTFNLGENEESYTHLLPTDYDFQLCDISELKLLSNPDELSTCSWDEEKGNLVKITINDYPNVDKDPARTVLIQEINIIANRPPIIAKVGELVQPGQDAIFSGNQLVGVLASSGNKDFGSDNNYATFWLPKRLANQYIIYDLKETYKIKGVLFPVNNSLPNYKIKLCDSVPNCNNNDVPTLSKGKYMKITLYNLPSYKGKDGYKNYFSVINEINIVNTTHKLVYNKDFKIVKYSTQIENSEVNKAFDQNDFTAWQTRIYSNKNKDPSSIEEYVIVEFRRTTRNKLNQIITTKYLMDQHIEFNQVTLKRFTNVPTQNPSIFVCDEISLKNCNNKWVDKSNGVGRFVKIVLTTVPLKNYFIPEINLIVNNTVLSKLDKNCMKKECLGGQQYAWQPDETKAGSPCGKDLNGVCDIEGACLIPDCPEGSYICYNYPNAPVTELCNAERSPTIQRRSSIGNTYIQCCSQPCEPVFGFNTGEDAPGDISAYVKPESLSSIDTSRAILNTPYAWHRIGYNQKVGESALANYDGKVVSGKSRIRAEWGPYMYNLGIAFNNAQDSFNNRKIKDLSCGREGQYKVIFGTKLVEKFPNFRIIKLPSSASLENIPSLPYVFYIRHLYSGTATWWYLFGNTISRYDGEYTYYNSVLKLNNVLYSVNYDSSQEYCDKKCISEPRVNGALGGDAALINSWTQNYDPTHNEWEVSFDNTKTGNKCCGDDWTDDPDASEKFCVGSIQGTTTGNTVGSQPYSGCEVPSERIYRKLKGLSPQTGVKDGTLKNGGKFLDNPTDLNSQKSYRSWDNTGKCCGDDLNDCGKKFNGVLTDGTFSEKLCAQVVKDKDGKIVGWENLFMSGVYKVGCVKDLEVVKDSNTRNWHGCGTTPAGDINGNRMMQFADFTNNPIELNTIQNNQNYYICTRSTADISAGESKIQECKPDKVGDAVGDNIVLNPSFKEGITKWDVKGNYLLTGSEINILSGYSIINQTVPIQRNKFYTFAVGKLYSEISGRTKISIIDNGVVLVSLYSNKSSYAKSVVFKPRSDKVVVLINTTYKGNPNLTEINNIVISRTFYCTKDGETYKWNEDLDNSKDSCISEGYEWITGQKRTPYKWTGTYCCSEKDDIISNHFGYHESYNENSINKLRANADSFGACLNGIFQPEQTYAQLDYNQDEALETLKNVYIKNGIHTGCAILDKTVTSNKDVNGVNLRTNTNYNTNSIDIPQSKTYEQYLNSDKIKPYEGGMNLIEGGDFNSDFNLFNLFGANIENNVLELFSDPNNHEDNLPTSYIKTKKLFSLRAGYRYSFRAYIKTNMVGNGNSYFEIGNADFRIYLPKNTNGKWVLINRSFTLTQDYKNQELKLYLLPNSGTVYVDYIYLGANDYMKNISHYPNPGGTYNPLTKNIDNYKIKTKLIDDKKYCTLIENENSKLFCSYNEEWENYDGDGRTYSTTNSNELSLSFIEWGIGKTEQYGDNFTSIQQAECCPSNSCWNGTMCIAQFNGNTLTPAYPYVHNKSTQGYRCIDGKWIWSIKKANPDYTSVGFCDYNTQCYYSETQDGYNKHGQEYSGCINSGQFIPIPSYGDYYCLNGEWTTRTKMIFDELYNIVNSINTEDKYTIVCDKGQNGVVFNLDSNKDFISALSYTSSTEVNNFCVLRIYHGNQLVPDDIVIGSSLNTEINNQNSNTVPWKIFKGETQNSRNYDICSGKGKDGFESCGIDNTNNRYLYFNNKTKSFIYSNFNVGNYLISTGVKQKFLEFASAIFLHFYRNNDPLISSVEQIYYKDIYKVTNDFNTAYLAKKGNKKIFAFIEPYGTTFEKLNEFEAGQTASKSKYLHLVYENIVGDMCKYFGKVTNTPVQCIYQPDISSTNTNRYHMIVDSVDTSRDISYYPYVTRMVRFED